MKIWAQYIWRNYRGYSLLYLVFILPALLSPFIHNFLGEHTEEYFSKFALPAFTFSLVALSTGLINEFNSIDRLQLIPNMNKATRQLLLLLNIAFLSITFLLCSIHDYADWASALLFLATYTAVSTRHFLAPSKFNYWFSQMLIISTFFIFWLLPQLPRLNLTYTAFSITTIGSCYYLLPKGQRHSNTQVVTSRNNYRQPSSTSVIFCASPKALFRRFGLFGLQQTMMTYHVNIFALCYIGIISMIVLIPDRADNFLMMFALCLALIASHIPFFSEDTQVKSLQTWSLIPITHNRADFSKRFMKDALLSQLKLIFPVNLLLPLILLNNLDLAFSLSIITTVTSLLCAAFAWLSIAKCWKPLLPAGITIILTFASWLLAFKLSGELMLLIGFSIVTCAFTYGLYRLSYQSLALLDWH